MENLYFLGKSSLILAIFFCFYKVFLERETFYVFNRYFLLIGILSSLLLPLMVLTKTVYVEPQALPIDNLMGNMSMVDVAKTSANTSFWDCVLYAYLLGALFFIGRFANSLFSILRFSRKHKGIKKNGFWYLNINGLSAPFSFFNMIAYNANNASPQELKLILAHEQEHAKQLHSVDILLGRLLCALFWFSPFAWFYARAMEQNLEYLADAKVTEIGFPIRDYQLALVRVSSVKTPALTQSFYQSFIKKRIIMLNKIKSKSQNKFKVVLLLPILAIFLWSFNVSEVVVFKNIQTSPNAIQEKAVNNTGKPFRYFIKRNSTKKEIEAIAKKMKMDYKVDLKYSGLHYNDAGLITSIQLKMKDLTKDARVTLSQSDTDGIEDIILFRNEDEGLGYMFSKPHSKTKSISSTNNKSDSHSHSTTTIADRNQNMEVRRAAMEGRKTEMKARKTEMEVRKTEMEARENNLVQQREDLKKMQKQLEHRQLKLDQMQKDLQKRSDELKKGDINVSNSPNSKTQIYDVKDSTLILVDGKEKTRDYMNNLEPETIRSIDVIKDKEAVNAFGTKADGKNAVIDITTKKGDTDN